MIGSKAMTFIATPQTVEIALKMSQNGVPIVNVWHVDVGAAVTPTLVHTAILTIDAWISSDYKNIVSDTVGFDELVGTDVSVANGYQEVFAPTTLHGNVAGAATAANAAYVASLRTIHTGRNYRGRTYVPGIAASKLLDAQHVTASYLADVNSTFANLLAALVTAGMKLVVVSKWLDKVARVVGIATEVITIITDTKVDSQRRRTAN